MEIDELVALMAAIVSTSLTDKMTRLSPGWVASESVEIAKAILAEVHSQANMSEACAADMRAAAEPKNLIIEKSQW